MYLSSCVSDQQVCTSAIKAVVSWVVGQSPVIIISGQTGWSLLLSTPSFQEMSPKLFVKGGEGQKQSWVCGQNIVANYDDYNAD